MDQCGRCKYFGDKCQASTAYRCSLSEVNLEHKCLNGTENGLEYIPCELSNTTSCNYVMNSSYVSDFDLICHNAYIIPYMQSAMLAGSLIGTLIFGLIADIIGRRKTILWSIYVLAIAFLGIAVSPYTKMWQFLLFSCSLGGFGAGGQVRSLL